MMQLHQDKKKFEQKNIKIIAICPEDTKTLQTFADKYELSFDLVADSDHVLAKKYGQQVKFLKLGRMPSQIVMDKDESVVFQHYASNMTDIIENNDILLKM